MKYIEKICFPDSEKEFDVLYAEKRTCFDSCYPFGVLSGKNMNELKFSDITVLYGPNGCGKTTALNITAQALGARRSAPFNSSSFFASYVELCEVTYAKRDFESEIITSDDVFSYMLDLRLINSDIDRQRDELFGEYTQKKRSDFKLKSIADYEELKSVNTARTKTQSRYVRENLNENPREHSNGESAFKYFAEKLEEGKLYILDEPENSLSVARQIELVGLLSDYARFFNCQFIISTHSVFVLAVKDALIWDMSEDEPKTKTWEELDIVKQYKEFFAKNTDWFK